MAGAVAEAVAVVAPASTVAVADTGARVAPAIADVDVEDPEAVVVACVAVEVDPERRLNSSSSVPRSRSTTPFHSRRTRGLPWWRPTIWIGSRTLRMPLGGLPLGASRVLDELMSGSREACGWRAWCRPRRFWGGG